MVTILFTVLFLVSCNIKTPTAANSPAIFEFPIPIFESKVTITSIDEVKSIFKDNSNEIMDNLISCNSNLDSERFNYTNYWKINILLFDYLDIKEEKRIGDYYSVEVPMIPKDFSWEQDGKDILIVYSGCNSSSETRALEDGKLTPCKSGETPRKKIASKVKFYVSADGVIYFDFGRRMECDVTNLPADSFQSLRKNPYIHVWAEPSVTIFPKPTECLNDDYLSYMESNSDIIVDAKVENVYKSETGYSGQTRQDNYLKIQNLIQGNLEGDTIILMVRLWEDENPNLSKDKLYRLYLKSHTELYSDKKSTYTYWLICGIKSIQTKS